MLAYVFWHVPRPDVDRDVYERALAKFHETLGRSPPVGFIRSECHHVEGASWLSEGEGYEDWYFLEGSAALDALDEAAVSGVREVPHDEVARLAASGAGGLYRGRWTSTEDSAESADKDKSRSACLWTDKPAGVPYAHFFSALQSTLPHGAEVWQRQMVLGPAPEFALIGGPGLAAFSVSAVPTRRLVHRSRVWPPGGCE